jgi:hypothetical protein
MELRKEVDSSTVKKFLELITLRREMHRDKLETDEDREGRGKALECRSLLKLFEK